MHYAIEARFEKNGRDERTTNELEAKREKKKKKKKRKEEVKKRNQLIQ